MKQRDQQRKKESWGARGRDKRQKISRKATQGEHNQEHTRPVLAVTAHRVTQGMKIVQAKIYGKPKGEKWGKTEGSALLLFSRRIRQKDEVQITWQWYIWSMVHFIIVRALGALICFNGPWSATVMPIPNRGPWCSRPWPADWLPSLALDLPHHHKVVWWFQLLVKSHSSPCLCLTITRLSIGAVTVTTLLTCPIPWWNGLWLPSSPPCLPYCTWLPIL